MVHVSAFMTPQDKVVSCMPEHSVRTALDLMITNKVGCVIAMDAEKKRPVGIVTRSDMLDAYHKELSLDLCTVAEIMHTNLVAVVDTMFKDDASKVFEKNKKHHAIVINKAGDFVGVISSMDIAAECARDARAWPWNRVDAGKFIAQKKAERDAPGSPTGVDEGQPAKRSSFMMYIDNLEYLDM